MYIYMYGSTSTRTSRCLKLLPSACQLGQPDASRAMRGESDVPSSLFGLLPHLVDPGWTNLLETPLVH